MEQILKADIFFFITTIAVVGTSVVLTIAFVYIIQILRDVRYITRRVRKEADGILEDVQDARKFVKKEVKRAADVKDVIGMVSQLITGRGKKQTSRKKKI